MKKVLYVGIFNGQNIGDLVISDQIYKFLRSENLSVTLIDFITLNRVETPTTEIQFLKSEPTHEKVKKFLSNSHLTSSLFIRNDEFISNVYSMYKENAMYCLSSIYCREYIKGLETCDFVCIGGGNLLMTLNTNYWAVKVNRLVKLARKKKKKVFIISVGAGPISSKKAQKLFSDALNMADYITVRDENSKILLEDTLNVKQHIAVSGDPALLLNNVRVEFKNKEQKNIAISVIPFGKKSFSNLKWYKESSYYIEMYEKLIVYLYDKNPNFVFYLFSSAYTDYEVILQLENHIKERNKKITEENLKVIHIKSLGDLLEFYQKQDLVIGTRMHSLIIAFTQYMPIIAISWQDKVSGFMSYIGMSQYCYNLNNVNAEIDKIYKDSEKLINGNQKNQEKLLSLRENYTRITSSILHSLKQERQ
ncbi:polysaccharide pyruvyl transferase family protein [Methanosarcina mazei]|uniref:Polysaccharide pyruvyl transferase n=1 Tax=Methanosarcina mazei S-6 TaxID=213585 RepID=A0A0E3RBX8_METMZ|nr:polysaccharide pyruvyl transferase family protein [Methanosarcina mazei]AKB63328.1 Polysaccharide pyruvyl transferase [Methanosarcina mazei S-6]